MNISDLPALLFEGVLQKWKRRVIVYAICAVCTLGIAIETITVGRILLERAFGPIGGRLVVAGILLFVIVAALVALWQLERRAAVARQAERDDVGSENDPRVALIAQAINLGYTFARGFGPDKTDAQASGDEAPANEKQAAAQAAE